jgi:hypothetical protein
MRRSGQFRDVQVISASPLAFEPITDISGSLRISFLPTEQHLVKAVSSLCSPPPDQAELELKWLSGVQTSRSQRRPRQRTKPSRCHHRRVRSDGNVTNEADPFIKKRLLRLASNYDAITTPFASGPAPSNPTGGLADSSVETGRCDGD